MCFFFLILLKKFSPEYPLVYVKNKKTCGIFQTSVGTYKGKLAAKHGGGINQPISRALEDLSRKGRRKGSHREKSEELLSESNDFRPELHHEILYGE